MYLSDKDIKGILPQLQITARNDHHPFREHDQVQPCSIDMRLDEVFWTQKRRRGPMDLRLSVVEQVDTRRYWRRVTIATNQVITLKPREFVLGRIYENFTIPNGYAGKIAARSSFARLGLMVHCAADFINPGYRGHMPLQLVNVGNTEIRLSPFLPICQLILIKLTNEVDRTYGHDDLDSKYMDDDGGPSYWWKDRHVKKLKESMAQHSVPNSIHKEVFPLISKLDTDLIERFQTFISEQSNSTTTNATEVLDRFAVQESKSHRWANVRYWFPAWAGPAFLMLTLGSFLRQPYGYIHFSIWASTVLFLMFFGWRFFFCDSPGDYLTPATLDKLNRDRED